MASPPPNPTPASFYPPALGRSNRPTPVSLARSLEPKDSAVQSSLQIEHAMFNLQGYSSPCQGKRKGLAEQKAFYAFLCPLFRKDWVVDTKRPFGGPEHVVHDLARWTHRAAIFHASLEGLCP